MIVLYIVILIYFNYNIASIVNVFMLSIEKKNIAKFLRTAFSIEHLRWLHVFSATKTLLKPRNVASRTRT